MATIAGLRFHFYSSFWRYLLCSLIFAIIIVWSISVRIENLKVLYDLSENSLKYVYHKDKPFKFLNSTEAKRLINKHNKEETILNLDKFGPIDNNTIILVVSVSNLHEPLKYLVASLNDLNEIQETLLVFSHLTFDENLNNFIQTIDFCRVLQIFYPYSLQVFKDEFPGYNKNDCPSDMRRQRAESLQCNGVLNPDIHGKYRKPSQAQKKHYWWWTANRIFENFLYVNHKGIVVFLEDDIFVLSDFLYMLVYLHKLSKSMPQCEFIYLGLHEWSLRNNTYHVDLTTWYPEQHSSVLAFDKSVWNVIHQQYDLFCDVDDSSWARSLFYISLNRGNNPRFKVVYSTIPRAIKITTCFFNGWYNNCNVMDNVIQALKMQRYLKTNLFPAYLEVYTHIELEEEDFVFFDILQGEGGWNDPRDKALCLVNITENKIKKILTEIKRQLPDIFLE